MTGVLLIIAATISLATDAGLRPHRLKA